MSEPIEGDMREFGFTDSAPAELEGDTDNAEEYADPGEQVVEAAPEPEVVQEEAFVEEVVEEEGEEPEEEALSEAEILAKVAEYYKTPDASEAPVSGPTLDDVNRVLDQRLSQMGGEEPTPVAEPDPSEQEYQAFQSLYEAASEEDRPALQVQFQKLREARIREEFEAKLESRAQVDEQKQAQINALKQLKKNVDEGLNAALQRGGMNKVIAEEFVTSGDYNRLFNGQFGQSILSQTLSAAPSNMYSAAGVLMSTYAAGGLVQDGYQQMLSNPQPNGEQGPAGTEAGANTHTTAVPAKASRTAKKQKKLTPEEQYGQAIAAAGQTHKVALPFLYE